MFFTCQKKSLSSLIPFFLFIGLFVFSSVFLKNPLSPLFLCLLASLYAIATCPSSIPFNKRIDLFIQGSAQPTIIAMGYIFILSTAFTHILSLIGGTDAAVLWGLTFMPSAWLLPGFFTIVSLFATAVGSSMSAIAAFMPIGFKMAQMLQANSALFAGIVVSGAMLGDNLSIISDTTIAATQMLGARARDKFKTNIFLVLPAFIATILVLLYFNNTLIVPQAIELTQYPLAHHPITILPYILLLFFAICGAEVLSLLLIGIIAGLIIGIALGTFTPFEATSLFFEGFFKDRGMQEVFVLVFLIGGLSHLVEQNGGIEYLLAISTTKIRSSRSAELFIIGMTMLINSFIAINTITILVAGPIVKQLAHKTKIPPQRAASLLDIAACICQGILPYAPQLLLASSLAQISPIAILPYLHYQWFIFIVILFSAYLSHKGTNP